MVSKWKTVCKCTHKGSLLEFMNLLKNEEKQKKKYRIVLDKDNFYSLQCLLPSDFKFSDEK